MPRMREPVAAGLQAASAEREITRCFDLAGPTAGIAASLTCSRPGAKNRHTAGLGRQHGVFREEHGECRGLSSEPLQVDGNRPAGCAQGLPLHILAILP